MLDRTTRQERRVTVNGAAVQYFIAGSGTARSPMVMIHGTGGSVDGHFGYLFPMHAFRQQVVAMNLADPPGALTLDALVDQVVGVVAATVPEGPITLVGYSLGAVIAAATAARLNAKVENLVLVAGWMKTDTHQAFRNRIWRRLRNEDSPTLTEYMTFCAFSQSFMALRTAEEMAAAANILNITPFVDRQMDLNARIDISDRIQTIVSRTLIIGCTFDMTVPIHHSKQLFGAIDDARYTEIPSGHAVVHERPAELFSLIDTFTRAPAAYPSGAIIPAQKP